MKNKYYFTISCFWAITIFICPKVLGLKVIEKSDQPQVDYIITIDSRKGEMAGSYYDVSINLERCNKLGDSAKLIDAFSFLITYDKRLMRINEVNPGALLEDLEIDNLFFYLTDGLHNGDTLVMARIECKLKDKIYFCDSSSTSNIVNELIKLNIRVSSDLNTMCKFIPIRFYWVGCDDNILIDYTNNQKYYGAFVYNRIMEEFQNGYYARTVDITNFGKFDFSGPKTECYELSSESRINDSVGTILFKSGGIHIHNAPCWNNPPGDIDTKGRPNEIGDISTFIDYLLYDSVAFKYFPMAQYAGTEVNNDKDTATVADLVFLIRLYNEDHLWPWELIHVGVANFAVKDNIVGLADSLEVGAALFIFKGEIVPKLSENVSHMTLIFSNKDGETRALVYSLDNNKYLTYGDILVLEEDFELKSVDAGNINGGMLQPIINIAPNK